MVNFIKINRNLSSLMKPKKGFLKYYLFIALGFGLLGLTDTLLTFFDVVNNVYTVMVMNLNVLFFFFNIAAIAIFHHHRVGRIAFILPIYHIATFVVFFGVGLSLAYMGVILQGLWMVLLGISLVSSLFEILLAFYLMAHLQVLKKD